MNDSATINHNIPSPYKVIKKLGSGSFGHVYLVTNGETQQQCVIKILHPISQQPNFIKQAKRLFQQEATILKKVNHPQVPKLIDYFEEEGEFYLVEEYIQGYTLRNELKPNQPWTQEATIKLLQEGLSILKDIHHCGIIHRDVKPDNFIRRQQDQKLVLIDFGAVKEFNIEQSRLIDPTVALGTRGYMPTEQARGKPYKNSDIYALGMIAIQALTGKNPMDLEEDEEGEIIWRNGVNINPLLGDILSQMVRYHHKLRYQCADDVIKALNHYLQPKSNIVSTQLIDNSPSPSETINKTEIINNTNSAVSTSGKNEMTSPRETQNNSFGDWLKSSVGSTVTTALTIGLIATGGAYFMNSQEKARIEQEQNDFVALMDTKLSSGAYEECFTTVEEELEKESTNITSKILSQYQGQCRLEQGKQLAQFSNYTDALAVVNKIPKDNEYHNQAQVLSEEWSKMVFEKAKTLYTEEGKLDEALKEIDTIPDNSVKKASLIVVSKWQEEYKQNSYLLGQAQKDLEYNNCESAIETVSQISGSNYWLLEGKKVVDKAEKCLIDRTKNSPNNSNNQSSPLPSLPTNGHAIPLCPGPLCPD
ncbi:serine/threonine protein kinase [Geminocystis herdmanii]|uniref:serine/threonine protein kinase n=1 Tax=Geminocystis herdmanii TaxID=669359 RepID=UPI0003452126|nr:serine/threonine-protein kinase [Geminocystis herdmanii]